MDDVTIRGANQLAAISAHLNAAGNGGLRREMLRGIQRAGKPLKAAGAEAIRDNLPHRGGLSATVAGQTTVGLRTRTSGSTPGVRVVARSRSHIAAMDRGRVRKPVYAQSENRADWTWVTQQIPADWWERRLAQEAPAVRLQVVASMNYVAERIAHG